MKKNLFHLAAILLLGIIASCNKPELSSVEKLQAELADNKTPNTLTQQEQEAGWQLLFDGSNIRHWHGYNMDHVPDCWTVEDGALKVLAEGMAESNMGIVTNKEYQSFALSIEFKLTPKANSGIIYQVGEDTIYHYPYETGAEFQVIDQDGWDGDLEDWQITGANYAMHPPLVKNYKAVGEWNEVLLVVDGNKITHILNGDVLVEYEKHSPEWKKLRDSGKWAKFPDYGKYDKGHIALQNHGAIVYYRDIKIKEWKSNKREMENEF